jgi:hypothetical protein
VANSVITGPQVLIVAGNCGYRSPRMPGWAGYLGNVGSEETSRTISMLHQLVYSSAPAQNFMQSHLHMILRHARQKNKLRNVTGLLVFVDNTFLQVLEGEETEVKNVFDKIKSDHRHKDIKLLSDSPIQTRAFENWEMAYATTTAKEMANWAGLHNTTTVKKVLEHITQNPDLASGMFSNLLQSVSRSKQEQ